MFMLKKTAFLLSFMVLTSSLFGVEAVCSYQTSQWIELNREKYACKIDTAQFVDFKGKRILLSTIEDRSKNTSNLSYYNPEGTIGYALYYSSHSMRQPVVSYYWYALKKAFECTGIIIEEYGPAYDAELSLKFDSLTDEEITFWADLIRNNKNTYAKSRTVKMPKIETAKIDPFNNPVMKALGRDETNPLNPDAINALEQRGYDMLDAIVTSILGDPDFKNALLSE